MGNRLNERAPTDYELLDSSFSYNSLIVRNLGRNRCFRGALAGPWMIGCGRKSREQSGEHEDRRHGQKACYVGHVLCVRRY